MEAFGEQACAGAQILDWFLAGEDAGSGIDPARDVRLGDARLDLVGSDHLQVVDRPFRGLGPRNEARDAAAAPLLARSRSRRLGNGTGEHPTDLEKASRSRRRADAKDGHLLRAPRCRSPQETENDNDGGGQASTMKTFRRKHRPTT